eukprot:tig00000350_g24304.t1
MFSFFRTIPDAKIVPSSADVASEKPVFDKLLSMFSSDPAPRAAPEQPVELLELEAARTRRHVAPRRLVDAEIQSEATQLQEMFASEGRADIGDMLKVSCGRVLSELETLRALAAKGKAEEAAELTARLAAKAPPAGTSDFEIDFFAKGEERRATMPLASISDPTVKAALVATVLAEVLGVSDQALLDATSCCQQSLSIVATEAIYKSEAASEAAGFSADHGLQAMAYSGSGARYTVALRGGELVVTAEVNKEFACARRGETAFGSKRTRGRVWAACPARAGDRPVAVAAEFAVDSFFASLFSCFSAPPVASVEIAALWTEKAPADASDDEEDLGSDDKYDLLMAAAKNKSAAAAAAPVDAASGSEALEAERAAAAPVDAESGPEALEAERAAAAPSSSESEAGDKAAVVELGAEPAPLAAAAPPSSESGVEEPAPACAAEAAEAPEAKMTEGSDEYEAEMRVVMMSNLANGEKEEEWRRQKYSREVRALKAGLVPEEERRPRWIRAF